MQTKIKMCDLELAVDYIRNTSVAEWLTIEICEASENLYFKFEDGEKHLAELAVHPAQQNVTPKLRTTKNLYRLKE